MDDDADDDPVVDEEYSFSDDVFDVFLIVVVVTFLVVVVFDILVPETVAPSPVSVGSSGAGLNPSVVSLSISTS